MKPLFLALVLTNVLVFIWATWLAPDNTVHAAAPPANVPSLTLASEAGGGKSKPASADAAGGTQAKAPGDAANAPTQGATQVAAADGTPAPSANDAELLTNVQRCVS